MFIFMDGMPTISKTNGKGRIANKHHLAILGLTSRMNFDESSLIQQFVFQFNSGDEGDHDGVLQLRYEHSVDGFGRSTREIMGFTPSYIGFSEWPIDESIFQDSTFPFADRRESMDRDLVFVQSISAKIERSGFQKVGHCGFERGKIIPYVDIQDRVSIPNRRLVSGLSEIEGYCKQHNLPYEICK